MKENAELFGVKTESQSLIFNVDMIFLNLMEEKLLLKI
jgi:hypothetical protein